MCLEFSREKNLGTINSVIVFTASCCKSYLKKYVDREEKRSKDGGVGHSSVYMFGK